MASIKITFPTANDIRFTTEFEGQPTESQFEVAGREMVGIAAMLRSDRIKGQLVPKVAEEKPATSVPAPAKETKWDYTPPWSL